MATTKIKYIKSNIKYTIEYTTDKEKTAKELKKSIAYIDDAIKNQGQFITGLHCVPQVADIQFKGIKTKYNKNDGVLGFHIIQSFKPGEITPEKAHELGIELTKRLTNDKHQAVISTHLDKAHIHNHIVFNSVSHVDGRKWHNDQDRYKYKLVERLSNDICREHGLSVIEKKNEKAMHYKEWAENKKGNSWKAHIKQDIDKVIKDSKSWNEFLDKMKANGYEIKHGKYISFRPYGKERFVRGKTLGFNYTQDNIQTRIKMATLGITMPKRTFKVKRFNRMPIRIRSIHLVNIILIIKILKTIRNRADRYNYTPLDKRYNTALVKQLSKSLIICKKENINTYQKLTTKLEQNRIYLNDVRRLIKSNESINKVDKNLYDTYYELMEKDKIYKKLKSDLDNANKEIKKTHKQKEQDITKIIKKDLGLSR
jgi:hypothetical protein